MKNRDSDHADIVRTTGARRVRIAQVREIERRRILEALAPATDVRGLPGREHVARLHRRCGLAADDVHPVDTRHRHHSLTAAIAERDRVFVARPADDVRASLVLICREQAAFGAVEDLDVERGLRQAHRSGGRGNGSSGDGGGDSSADKQGTKLTHGWTPQVR